MSRLNATGLRKKDTYEQMIDYLQNDQELIKYPNRYFKQLRDSPWLTQLDDEYQDKLEEQQLNEAKIIQKETIIREAAQAMGMSASEARAIHQNITNNFSTTINNSSSPPPPPSAPDVRMSSETGFGTDARMTSETGVGTEHPLKEDTGTGTDWTIPPDRFNPQPPPAPHGGSAQVVIHSSTSRQNEGVNSAIFHYRSAPVPTPEAPPIVNPILKPGREPPKTKPNTPEFYIGSDTEDNAMNLQRQDAVTKDYMAEEQRTKNTAMVSQVKAYLDGVENMKPRTAIKIASMAQNGLLNRLLAMAQTNARSRLVNQNRQNTAQAINQSMREAEIQRWQQYLAEHQANQQRALEDQIKQNVAKKEAQDAEQRLREAQIENSKLNMSRLITIRNKGREEQSDSEGTVFVYEGDDEEEPQKARKPVKPPVKKAKQSKLESEEANEALSKGLSNASRVVPVKKKTKLGSVEAKEALNKGLSKASRVVPGKTALNVKYRKGIKEGLTNAKVKAHVEPQPDSTTTVIRKKKSGVILPIKEPQSGLSYTAIKTPRQKHRTGQMERVRQVVLPVH